jgi:hypothetical protein
LNLSLLKSINYFRYLISVAVLLCFQTASFTQMKVGDNPTVINPNSILELESPNQGLLMPRIALTATTNPSPLTSHIAGMTVYNITSQNDVLPGIYVNDGSKWLKLIGTGSLSTPTIIGTNPTNTLAIIGLGAGNPSTDEILVIDPVTGIIKKSAISSFIKKEQLTYLASDGQTQFSTPLPISDIDKINVYRNGARIGATIVNSTTIALEPGVVCVSGDEIRIVQLN